MANRDVKLENLLVDTASAARPLLKICDFSYSKHDADSSAKTMVGTAAYLAPEVVRWQDAYDAKVGRLRLLEACRSIAAHQAG